MARKENKKKRPAETTPTAVAEDQVSAESTPEEFDVDVEQLPEPVQALIRRLEIERDEAIGARQRALADYVNFQRRANENETRALDEGRSTIVRGLLPALDNFDLALQMNPESTTLEQLSGGVRMVRDELARVLEMNGVRAVSPKIGDEFDPNLHSAMMRQPTDEHEPGQIVMVMQVGYMYGERVLRPASVAVAAAVDRPGEPPGEPPVEPPGEPTEEEGN